MCPNTICELWAVSVMIIIDMNIVVKYSTLSRFFCWCDHGREWRIWKVAGSVKSFLQVINFLTDPELFHIRHSRPWSHQQKNRLGVLYFTTIFISIIIITLTVILNNEHAEVDRVDEEKMIKYLTKSMDGPLKTVANSVTNKQNGFEAYKPIRKFNQTTWMQK